MSLGQQKTEGFARWWVLFLVFVAAGEIIGHACLAASVIEDDDWERAAEVVRNAFQPGDRIVSAPSWVDPLVRHELGDLIPLESAGASDLAGVDRLWELSVRGATSEWSGQATPTLEEKVGEVWVRRWDLKEPDIVYDFTRHILDRRAEYEKDGSKIPCILKKSHRGNGGLFRGPLPPEERFICEGRRTWSWIGPTVNEDLDQKPRHCVWQHPLGKEPLRVIFENVPLGNELRISTGLFYHHDRATKDNQYELRVTVGDNVGQTIVHRDGQGWITKAIDLRSLRTEQTHARVIVETTADQYNHRSVCWHGTMVGSSR